MYDDFVAWLNSKNSLMEQLQSGNDHNLGYDDYLNVKEEFNQRIQVLGKLRSVVPSLTCSVNSDNGRNDVNVHQFLYRRCVTTRMIQ